MAFLFLFCRLGKQRTCLSVGEKKNINHNIPCLLLGNRKASVEASVVCFICLFVFILSEMDQCIKEIVYFHLICKVFKVKNKALLPKK